MGIKIINEKKTKEYTFVEDSLGLEHPEVAPHSSNKNAKPEREYGLREEIKINNLKHRSKLTGGHNKQGHSPVYE